MELRVRPVRYRIKVNGIVQGVGFRPFVYQLAHRHGLKGWVLNSTEGVILEVEGPKEALESFLDELRTRYPRLARISDIRVHELPPAGYEGFTIRRSRCEQKTVPVIPPDASTCDECMRELYDPSDRRYRYPFINCTFCGPRYSIILALPYDRPNTTMRAFQMCDDCRREYEDPLDRRFHAQPVACPKCGPKLLLMDLRGEVIAEGEEALSRAVEAVLKGRILALKGIGGYQLVVDATSDEALRRLRERKRRPSKPFALMMGSIEQVRRYCHVSPAEEELLYSVQAPIVLLRIRDWGDISEEVAPGSPFLGVMLPYTPLHRLMMDAIKRPVVCTSGNLSEEPICTSEEEALKRLGGIADLILANDRPIARHVDDSVTMWLEGTRSVYVIRRARGYAPMPLILPERLGIELKPTIAMGAHLKNTVALGRDNWIVVSQHIGDLENLPTYQAFERTYRDLMEFLRLRPEVVAVDMHPDYHSTLEGERLAEELGAELVRVQHHHAHVVSALIEHLTIHPEDAELAFEGESLGLSWDGTGYGTDGTVWGGEVLAFDIKGFRRVGHLLRFYLPGGERAIRQSWRVAISLLREAFPEGWLELASELGLADESELRRVAKVMESGLAPLTTSMGRLFDGVSALLGLKREATYEGEPAVALEWMAWHGYGPDDLMREAYEPLIEGGLIDWRPTVREVIGDLRRGVSRELIALRFHGWLVRVAVELRRRLSDLGELTVISGGCFQNRLLVEGMSRAWEKLGLGRLVTSREYPPNDGGISLGQVIVASLTAEA